MTGPFLIGERTKLMRFKNQTAIVTGAGDGIGRGIALALAREGANVGVCALTREKVAETGRQVEALGRKAYVDHFDAGDEDAVLRFVEATARECGPPTFLIPNAAVMPVVNLAEMTAEQMDACYSAKVKSAALFSKHCIPHMKSAGRGSIIFMSSVTGNVGFAQHSFYGAMNAALHGMARGLAMELAPFGIRANCVSPGTVDSPMLHRYIEESGQDPAKLRAAFDANHPRGKVASIEEVAATFLFLASEDAANITGTDLRCDGGFSFKGGQAASDSSSKG